MNLTGIYANRPLALSSLKRGDIVTILGNAQGIGDRWDISNDRILPVGTKLRILDSSPSCISYECKHCSVNYRDITMVAINDLPINNESQLIEHTCYYHIGDSLGRELIAD